VKQIASYSKNNSYSGGSIETFLQDMMKPCKSDSRTNDSFVYLCEVCNEVNYYTLSACRSGYDISADRRYAPFTHMYYGEIDDIDFKNGIKSDSISRIFDRDFINQSEVDKLVLGEMNNTDLVKFERYILDETQVQDFDISNEDLAQILSYIYSENRIYLRLSKDDNFPLKSRLLLKKIYSCIPYALRIKSGCAVGFSSPVDKNNIKIFIGTQELTVSQREDFDYADLTTSSLKLENRDSNKIKTIDASVTNNLLINQELRREVFDEFDCCFSQKSNNPLNGYTATDFKEFYDAISYGIKACEYYINLIKPSINYIMNTDETGTPYIKYEIYPFDNDRLDSKVFEVAKQYCFDDENKIISEMLAESETFDDIINNEWFQLVSHFARSYTGEDKGRIQNFLTTQNLGLLLKNTLQKYQHDNEKIYHSESRITESKCLNSYCEELSSLLSDFPPDSIMNRSINQFISLLKYACLNINVSHQENTTTTIQKITITAFKEFFEKNIDDILDNYKEHINNFKDEHMELVIQNKKDELIEAFQDDSFYEFISDFFEMEFGAWFYGIKQELEKQFVSNIAGYYFVKDDITGLKNIKEILDREGIDCNFIKKILDASQNKEYFDIKYQELKNQHEDEISILKEQHREEYNKVQEDAMLLFERFDESSKNYKELKNMYITADETSKQRYKALQERSESKFAADSEDGYSFDKKHRFSRAIIKFMPLVAVLGILWVVVIAINFSPLSFNIQLVRDTGHIAPIMSQYIPPDGTMSEWYDFTFIAEGVPSPSWSYDGDLPTGLTLHPSDGRLYGRPTMAGRFYFMVTATNEEGNVSEFISIVIEHPLQRPSITGFDVPSGSVGEQYYFRFEALGHPAPYWTYIGILPSGLRFSEDGLLSGTPTESGYHTFSVRARNSVSIDIRGVTLYVYYSTPVYAYDTTDYDTSNIITNDPIDNALNIEESSIGLDNLYLE